MRVSGVDVEIHWTLAALLALFLVFGGLDAAVFAVVLFGSVVIHELCHSLLAKRYRVPVSRIILVPIGGISVIDDFSMPPETELRVSLAGPASSLLIASAALAVSLLPPFAPVAGFAAQVAQINFILGAFNLVPALPLDGGRAWRALKQRTESHYAATRDSVRLSKTLVLLFVLLTAAASVFVDSLSLLVWNGVIALFVYFGADAELEMAQLQAASGGLRVADAMRKKAAAVPADETVRRAFELALQNRSESLLVSGGSKNAAYRIARVGDFALVPRNAWARTPIGSVAVPVPGFGPGDGLFSAWKRMRSADAPIAPVLEGGRLAGELRASDVERLLYIRRIAL